MRNRPLILATLVFAIIIGLRSVNAQIESNDIKVSPSVITLHLIKKPWGGLTTSDPSVTINVHTLEPNVTVVDVFADTFFEEKDRWPPISSKLLEFSIANMELNGLTRSEVEVVFDLPTNMRPSSYKSNIHLTSSKGSILSVPVSLSVSESEWVIGFWILIGVLLNLLLFMIKDIIDERNRLRETLDNTETKITSAYNAICRAIRERRIEDLGPASKYILAHIEFTNMVMEWNKAVKENALAGSFTYIGKKADRIVEIANSSGNVAKNVETAALEFLNPPTVYNERKSPEDRLKYNQVRDYIWRSRTLQYLALLLTFAIIVLNSWQTYLKEATIFGASGFADYIAALLFGFGSQTVLTQGVGMAKSWAESRQAE